MLFRILVFGQSRPVLQSLIRLKDSLFGALCAVLSLHHWLLQLLGYFPSSAHSLQNAISWEIINCPRSSPRFPPVNLPSSTFWEAFFISFERDSWVWRPGAADRSQNGRDCWLHCMAWPWYSGLCCSQCYCWAGCLCSAVDFGWSMDWMSDQLFAILIKWARLFSNRTMITSTDLW